MKAALIAGCLGFLAFQVAALFDPLRAMLSVFLPWQRVVVVGAWCAFLSITALLGGRKTAARYRWPAGICIALFGAAFAIVHFPTGRYGPMPVIRNQYLLGVVEMAAIWLTAALVSHWMAPETSQKGRHD
jgi:hypothetical protein